MALRNFISASLGLFLLTQCNTKTVSDSDAKFLSLSTKTLSANSLTGEWKYNNTIWYSSELSLQDNGTFTFHDQGCYGQKFSQGQWTNNNGIIILTSFDSFKQKEQRDTAITMTTTTRQAQSKLKNGKIEYSFIGFKAVSTPILTNPHDTVRVYFDKIQLQLQGDTLYCMGSNKLPEDAKFYRTKNNR